MHIHSSREAAETAWKKRSYFVKKKGKELRNVTPKKKKMRKRGKNNWTPKQNEKAET